MRSRTRKVTRPAQFGGLSCSSELVQTTKCNEQACPIDCLMGVWNEWTTCTQTCGLGRQSRSRVVMVGAAFGGVACGATAESRTCNSQPCPVDCAMESWGEWTTCTKTCGTGSTTRQRKILTAPAYGGKKCGGTEEKKVCNEQPCPVDCVMGGWSSWSSCSTTCGGGSAFRTRKVEVSAQFGGKACLATSESKACNVVPCPVDCQMGAWTGWTTCNRACGGGSQSRTRPVVVAAANNGKACSATFETQTCNTQPCPVDCVMGDWSTWTPCDKTCGKGTRSRNRNVSVQSQYGGKACEATVEINECNPQQCPQDCVVAPWSAWTECDKKCGGGMQTRSRAVLVESKYAGRECPSLQETQKCNQQPCPVDCVLSAWSDWTTCSQICGSGSRTRSRKITVAPANGGKQCEASLETQVCNTNPCAVDCKVTEWSQWSECSATCGGGKQSRLRKVAVGSRYGGAACPSLEETKDCNQTPCPVDCIMGQWMAWGACSKECGKGVQSRTRTVTRQAAFGGVACGASFETKECNTQECPVDCVMAPWGIWSECDKTCGGGFTSRTRVVQRPAAFGGVACGVTVERQQCNLTPCPVNCVLGTWSSWGTCSKPCGLGTQTRTRSVVTAPVAGGKACEATQEVQQCNVNPCIVNCKQSDWSAWSACSATCGKGTQSRTRTTVVQPVAGGVACGATVETQECTGLPVCPVDCVMGDWTVWSACSVTCGKGTKARSRLVKVAPNAAGKACDATYESAACELNPCPVNCVMTTWGTWSVCDKSCGGGLMRRRRSVVTPAANNGLACGATEEAVACNTQTCSVDCVMSAWGAYTTCSATCGAGTQTRTRTVLTRPSAGGMACTTTLESIACNIKPCAVDCSMSDWGAWSACDKQCGGGMMTRTRTVFQAASNGGVACGSTMEQQQCNTGACTTDCVMSPWSEWSACSATCGSFALKQRIRNIITQPNGGAACGATKETQSCILPACSGSKVVVKKGLTDNTEMTQSPASSMFTPLSIVAVVAVVAIVVVAVVVKRRRTAQIVDDGFYRDF